jgi:hypothetical protein
MTDLDLDRLGDVWREQLNPAELERLRRTAAAVSRRARFFQILDVVGAVVAAGAVVLVVLLNPATETVALGSAAILLLLVSHVRLRKLRQVELRSLAGSAEDMLAQSIERVENKLKYQRFCLFGVVPGLVLGYVVASALVTRPAGGVLQLLGNPEAFRPLSIGILIAVVAGTVHYLVSSMRRDGHELEHLRAMHEAYRSERESTGS